MPRRIGELTETGIIAEMRAELRRLWRAVGSNQGSVGEYDKFTLASSTDSTHTLTYIPSLSLIPIACLNGLAGDYGTDYTVDFATGIVTWSAAKVAGDILGVFYQTTGDLVALSGTADTGSLTDNFNRTNSTSSLGTTSDGNATWVAAQGTWGINANQAYQTVFANLHMLAYVEAGLSDGTLQVSVPTPGGQNGAGLTIRYVDINNWYAVRVKSGVLLSTMIAMVGGVPTSLASFTFTVGNPLKVVMTGSTINVYDGATNTLLVTDTSGHFTTATKHGLYITANDLAPRLDDWSFTP